MNLSDGKLRFVELAGSARKPWVITMWTLVDAEACSWNLDYRVNLRDIWDDESYRETKLPKKRPLLAAVHPVDPAVVYFLQKGNLFGVNLRTKRVVDKCVALEPVTHLNIDEESSRSIITWNLPPSLTYSSGQMRGEGSPGRKNGEMSAMPSAFDMVLNSFMNAYTGGLYNSNVDVGQKRKRSDCFACESQIKHAS